ncbi:MAG: proline racemase family protein [Rhodobacteraceae bacterium]|nr:proline racemase family protein [Paracoccaceae bacterium]
MHSDTIIHMVSAHCEGEVGNVVTGGVAPPPGSSLWQQRDFLASDGKLRNLLLNEPRGGVFTHVNLLVPPRNPRAATGFLIMEPVHTPPMSGSNTICVACVCLETGIIAMKEGRNHFHLEVPAGLIDITATCHNGRVEAVEFVNVPSFADKLDQMIEVDGIGSLKVDTAWGGDSFVLVPARDLGFDLTPDEGREIAVLGEKITRAANEQIGFSHPEETWNHISFCQFTGEISVEGGVKTGTSAVVIDPGKIDRSPCGTGCSARMAVMAARGELAQGDAYIGRSIIGGRFDCRVTAKTELAGRVEIAPAIKGRAWITGTHQIMRDPADPWPQGYQVSDTWPGAGKI